MPIDQARIFEDCYGADMYGRIFLYIRAVYGGSAEERTPTLRMLVMAQKALCTGHAFPTNHYLVTDDLGYRGSLSCLVLVGGGAF